MSNPNPGQMKAPYRFVPASETVVTPQSIIDVQQDDARMFVFQPGTTLNDLVRAVNQIGAAPGDMIAVLEALKQAGAISGELIVI